MAAVSSVNIVLVAFALFANYLHAVPVGGDRELQLVQVLFRHGHRAPFRVYSTDPNPPSLWVEGLGELTKLGRIQHFALGSFLRKRYQDFITLNPREVDVISSEAGRCLYGAYSLLASFYAPPPDASASDDVAWQPIPVKYRPLAEDKYLQSDPNCPTADQEKRAITNRADAKAFADKYKDLYDFWSNKSGDNMHGYGKAGAVFKSLVVERTANVTIPDWALQTWDDLSLQADMCYYFHFASPVIHRLRAGPFLGRVIKLMKNKIENPADRKRVYLYSGHGSNIAVVLQALKLFDMRVPPYTACLIFELYKEQDGRHSFRLLYSNSRAPEKQIDEPKVLFIPGCTEYCPVEYLEQYTKDLIPTDWKKECTEGIPAKTSR